MARKWNGRIAADMGEVEPYRRPHGPESCAISDGELAAWRVDD